MQTQTMPVQQQGSMPVLPFKDECAEVPLPLGGALILVLLAGVAVSVWWKRHRAPSSALPRLLSTWQAAGPAGPEASTLCVVSTVRLDAATRLHVVRWQGRDCLVASHAAGPAVLLDRASPRPPGGVGP